MSLLHFSRTDRRIDGEATYFGRAEIDGLPFKGNAPPLLTEREVEDRIEPHDYFRYGLFDTSRPDQVIMGRTYGQVMERYRANWFRIVEKEKIWVRDRKTKKVKMFVYLEWVEPWMQIKPGG